MIKTIKRLALLLILIAFTSLFFYFHLYQYLSFNSLKAHRELLLIWSQKHFVWCILGFMVIYTLTVACSIPGATLLTLTSGFLFGVWLGTLLVIVSATLGALMVFLIVDLWLREWVTKQSKKWLTSMEQGFQRNAVSYLLFLRLLPLFPFWLVNIVPPLLGVSKRVFILTTLIGIIPGSLVYTLVGNGLGHMLDTNQTPNLGIIFDPVVLIPLLALALLSLAPVIYKTIYRRRGHNKNN